jgi:protein-tyrosine phosphatase
MRIAEIIPNYLYAGGNLDEQGWRFVEEHVTAVINVREPPDIPPFDPTNRLLLLWAPLADKVPPAFEWIIPMMNTMNSLLCSGQVLYVHDTAGINRLGFVLTAYYMQRFGLGRDHALSLLRTKKPDLNPNKDYMRLLGQYEHYLASYLSIKGWL